MNECESEKVRVSCGESQRMLLYMYVYLFFFFIPLSLTCPYCKGEEGGKVNVVRSGGMCIGLPYTSWF